MDAIARFNAEAYEIVKELDDVKQKLGQRWNRQLRKVEVLRPETRAELNRRSWQVRNLKTSLTLEDASN